MIEGLDHKDLNTAVLSHNLPLKPHHFIGEWTGKIHTLNEMLAVWDKGMGLSELWHLSSAVIVGNYLTI